MSRVFDGRSASSCSDHQKMMKSSAATSEVSEVKLEEEDCSLPGDIILTILVQLPVKSLLRLRCVSKNWRSMIDDPDFVNAHRLRSYHRLVGIKFLVGPPRPFNQENFLLVDEEGNETIVPLSEFYSHRIFVAEGVEGLICFGNTILNPTTRKRYELPTQYLNITIDLPLKGELDSAIRYQNIYQLGYDSLSKEYKVLSICVVYEKEYRDETLYHRQKFQMQVITLGASNRGNSWRDINHLVPEEMKTKCITISEHPGILYFKNEIYIQVKCRDRGVLMVFSVGEERFRFINIPEELENIDGDGEGDWDLVEVRDCIALIRYRWHKKYGSIGIEIRRLIIDTDHSEGNWEKIVSPWPKFVACSKEDFQHDVVCAVNNRENLVQSSIDSRNIYYYSFWDIKEGRFRTAPKLQFNGDAYARVSSKHVETLFDPTIRAKSS